MRLRFAFLLVLLFVAFALDLSLGSVSIPLYETVQYVLGSEMSNPAYQEIIESIRFPKAVTAALAGAALSVAGLVMQTLFRNPLADPFVLGINSGASLGVALVVLALGVVGVDRLDGMGVSGMLSTVLAASIGASLVLMIVLYLSRKVDIMTLLIVGLMIGYGTSAVVSILMYLSIPERLQSFISWTFGDFGSVEWVEMVVFAPVCCLGFVLALLCSKSLNAFLLGEVYAKSLGVNTRWLRTMLILSAAILAGTVTAYCGPIGFIGVAVPHLCRGIMKTTDHRILIPTCVIAGATIAMIADVLSQVPNSQLTLPLNAITSLIGAPVILWVLLRKNSIIRSFAR